MTLENTILQKLAEQAGSSRRHEFHVDDPVSGWNLYVTAERRDDLSCLVWELTLRCGDATSDLQTAADDSAERTLALTERLRVIEVDSGRGEAVLRTQPVTKRYHRLYYEAILEGSKAITLRRYQVLDEVGQKREQIAFALTHETLARLAEELTGA